MTDKEECPFSSLCDDYCWNELRGSWIFKLVNIAWNIPVFLLAVKKNVLISGESQWKLFKSHSLSGNENFKEVLSKMAFGKPEYVLGKHFN